MLLTHAPSLVSVGAHFVEMTRPSHCPNALLLFIYLTTQRVHRVECALQKCLVEHWAQWFCMTSAEFRCHPLKSFVQSWLGKKCLPRTDWQHTEASEGSHLAGVPQHLLQCWPPGADSLLKFRVGFSRRRQSNTPLLIAMWTWTGLRMSNYLGQHFSCHNLWIAVCFCAPKMLLCPTLDHELPQIWHEPSTGVAVGRCQQMSWFSQLWYLICWTFESLHHSDFMEKLVTAH